MSKRFEVSFREGVRRFHFVMNREGEECDPVYYIELFSVESRDLDPPVEKGLFAEVSKSRVEIQPREIDYQFREEDFLGLRFSERFEFYLNSSNGGYLEAFDRFVRKARELEDCVKV